jgi:peptidoglycan/LPS O-acetylase OafA/YrhL
METLTGKGGAAEPQTTRGLWRIAAVSTALGLGCMVAAMESLRSGATGFSFRPSLTTLAAFAAGTAAGLFYWKLAGRGGPAARRASFLLTLLGVTVFLYPLRFVPADQLPERAKGLGLAAVAISIGVFLLWRVKRFLDRDDAAVEASQKRRLR